MTTTTTVPRGTRIPTGPPPPEDGTARLRRWWVAGGAAGGLVVLILIATLVELPYVVISPGSARTVGDLVTIEGVPSYPIESVAFTTVSSRDATLFEAVRGWIDDDRQVARRESVRADRSREENRRYNAQLMDLSKVVATTVALRALGEDVRLVSSGTVVRRIDEGLPAEGVLEPDDVIVAVDGEPIDEYEELRGLLEAGGPGTSHRLLVERPAGTDRRVEVELATVPAADDPERGIIGIFPEERVADVILPFSVDIATGSVGGPSAGLAFALAIIDVLTPGPLTGDARVAVTGTMALDTTVGPVGGGVQKAVAVRNAGYDAFLVPSAEFDEVDRAVGDDLRVIPVDTLSEALDALATLGGDVSAVDRPGATAP